MKKKSAMVEARRSVASKLRKVKRTAQAQHGRRVHVYGWKDLPRKWAAGISVQTSCKEKRHFRGGDAFIAWMSRAELRKVRDALDRILG